MKESHKIEHRQADLTNCQLEITQLQLAYLRLLERKVDVLLQWVCHLADLTWGTKRLLKFPLHSENKNPNQKN
jgi:hypothetical protein